MRTAVEGGQWLIYYIMHLEIKYIYNFRVTSYGKFKSFEGVFSVDVAHDNK